MFKPLSLLSFFPPYKLLPYAFSASGATGTMLLGSLSYA